MARRTTDKAVDGCRVPSVTEKVLELARTDLRVFYNDKGPPIAWSELPLSCSSLTARPALTGIAKKADQYSVAGAAFAYLRGLCKTLKMGACEPSGLDSKK
jgi:hypothetical protein